MLSCVSRWSSRVSVHSSHSGWSTSVWPDMMSNRSLVTLVGYDQRQSLFGFVTQIIHREINACLSPSVYDWGFPWCRHQMHLQWVWSCWRSLLTSFWGKARHSRLSNSVSFVGHASKKKKKELGAHRAGGMYFLETPSCLFSTNVSCEKNPSLRVKQIFQQHIFT